MAASSQRNTLLPRMDATSAGPVSAYADDGIQINNTISSGTRNTQYNAVNQYFQTNTNPDQDHLDAQFRRALCSSCPQIDRTDLIDTKGEAVGGTREWVLETVEYKAWLQDDSSPLLWIWGGPGKGKTMLSIFLSQELEKEDKTLYFFCSAKDEKHSTAVGVLRGLLWHLTSLYPRLTRVLRKDFDSTTESALSSRDTLWEAFEKLTKGKDVERLYCIIDGLDECDKCSQLWLMKKFESFNTRSVANILKLIVVSRGLLGFKDAIQLRLDSDYSAQVKSSVEAFVENKVNTILERFHGNETLGQEVKDKLTARAQGTYLYVGFAAIELSKQATMSGILNTLEELPDGLSPLYSRLLGNVQPSRQRLSLRTLGFISLARRPLNLEELAPAIGYAPMSGALKSKENIRDLIDEFGPLIRISDHRQLIQCSRCRKCFQMPTNSGESRCPGCDHWRFVYVYDASADREPLSMPQLKQVPPPHVETVDLVHESVRDFLKNATLPDGTRFLPDEMHFQLAHACIDSLVSSEASESGFASYAADFWPFHARNCGMHAQELLSHPSSFFDTESASRTIWWLNVNGDTEIIPRLHMACQTGFTAWVDVILKSHKTSKLPGFLPLMRKDFKGRTPLHAAIDGGSPQIVDMLLRHTSKPKTFIDNKCNGNTALYEAAFRGNRDIAQLLIRHRANVNAKRPDGHTPLHIAARRGYIDVVELLLLHKADVHAMNRDGGTALHESAISGQVDVAAILLRHGADVDAKRRGRSESLGNSRTETALHIAANEGHEALAKLLLTHKADYNLAYVHGQSALHMAASRGHAGVVQLLLEHGAEINTMSSIGTALHAAAIMGCIGVVKLLLEHGANVNAKSKSSCTALYHAALHGGLATVTALLEYAPDVNARNLHGDTALSAVVAYFLSQQHAGAYGYGRLTTGNGFRLRATMRILVEHGAEFDADSSEGAQIRQLIRQTELDSP